MGKSAEPLRRELVHGSWGSRKEPSQVWGWWVWSLEGMGPRWDVCLATAAGLLREAPPGVWLGRCALVVGSVSLIVFSTRVLGSSPFTPVKLTLSTVRPLLWLPVIYPPPQTHIAPRPLNSAVATLASLLFLEHNPACS